MANIKEDIVQRVCTRPYFGGAFTILKPVVWAMQQDDTHPYYFGACTLTCTAPAMTQDTELIDLAIKYAKEREVFKRPISKFQGIQWMLADAATQLEAARMLTYYAADLKEQGVPFTKQAAMAKLFAAEASHKVVDTALQIHGGYGYMKEYAIERIYRDQRIDLRCPFCHNGELVEGETPAALDDGELTTFLKKRQGLLDGVCVTGGEPLLRPELEGLLGRIDHNVVAGLHLCRLLLLQRRLRRQGNYFARRLLQLLF